MRKLQTDEQWAAVVILPSELLIFHIGSIFFESISLHVSKKIWKSLLHVYYRQADEQ